MNSKHAKWMFLVFMGVFFFLASKSASAQTVPFDISFPPSLLLQQETSEFTKIGDIGQVASWEMPLNDAVLQFLGEKFAISKNNQQTQQITQIVQPAYTISDDVSISTSSESNKNISIRITNTTNNNIITFPKTSGEVSLLGQTISGGEIIDDTIDLLTKTTGNYLANLVGGSGLTILDTGGQAASPSVSLSNLTSDWVQSGAYDIVLNNTESALKILDSDGTNYAVFDVGNLSSDITYTLSGTTGTLLTSANYGDFLSALGTGDLLSTNNLSELTNFTTARSNLGLGTAAVQNVGAFLQVANNFSDLGNASTARSNLGLGSIATESTASFLQVANNLSDIVSLGTARGNLGLGTIATQSAGNIFLSGGSLTGVTIPGTLNTISGLGTSSFSSANISQWTNNSGFITSSTTDTLTNKTINAGSNTLSALTISNFSSGNISQWTNNSGFITSSTTDTLTNKTLTAPVINGVVTTSGLTLPAFTAGGNITGSGSPTISNFGTINGLTLTAASDGLTLAGGTTSRTLTLSGADITVGNVIKPTSSGSLTIQSTGANTLTLDSGGNAGINIGTSNANAITLGASATVSANKTLSVTDADSLLVGGNIIPQYVTIAVPMLASLLDQNVFVADADYQLSAARCVYSVGALLSGTLQVTVDTGTGSPGSGTDQLSSAINLSTTVNTVYSGTLIGSPTTITVGDKVSIDVGGTLTGLLGTCTLTLKRV